VVLESFPVAKQLNWQSWKLWWIFL